MAITKITNPDLFDLSTVNTSLRLPNGGNLTRPTSPSQGEWRYNTDLKYVEFWDGGAWVRIETDAIPPISPSEFFNINTYVGSGVDRSINGKFNEAVTFNGTSDLIDLPAILPVNSTSSSSATCWIKTSAAAHGTMDCILNAYSDDAAKPGWALFRESGVNFLRLVNYHLGGVTGASDGTIAINDGNWHFIAVVLDYSAGTLNCYLDGNSTPECSVTGFTPTRSDVFTEYASLGYQNLIPSGSGATRFYDGSMDQFRVYSDALTTSEISYIYTNENTSTAAELNPSGFPTNCVAAYQFDGDLSEVSGAYGAFDNGLDIGYIGLDFAPDFVWIKKRTGSGYFHQLYDSVRGVAEVIFSNSDLNQYSRTDGLTSFDSNGFSLGTNTNSNEDDGPYVAWSWKGGGAATTIAAGTVNSNTVDSSVSANTEAGFSIVSYTAPSSGVVRIAHGLGGTPDMVITKTYSVSGYNWYTWVTGMDTTSGYIYLDGSAADQVAAGYNMWNNGFTSTTYEQNVGASTISGASTIGYLWRSIPGYSSIGTYTGTGVEYGNYIYTTDDGTATGSNGFEPAFIIIKRTDSTANWRMFDNKRSPRNPRDQELYPNLDNAESLFVTVDFCKNGFELRTTDSNTNATGGTYIYIAVAGDPDTSTPTADNSFQPALYTGTGGASIAPLTFKPDLVWVKARDTATKWNVWYDSMRGNLSMVSSNSTVAAQDYPSSSPGGVYCTPNGYNVGSNSAGDLNTNTENYASWSWKAGGVATINNDGTQTASVSANVAGGFSIVRFTSGSGASTAGHGLGVAPTLFMFFRLDSAESRWTYTTVIDGSNDYLELNSDVAKVDATESAATSSVIYQPTTAAGKVYTVYCFANITGYQQVGYYAGVSTGTRTHITGFEPSFVMIKRTNATGDWCVYDSQRRSPASSIIFANLDDAEYTTDTASLYVTFVAGGAGVGGFTTPGTASQIDGSGDSFIYLAVK